MARKRLGELLLERGVISVQQLEEGLFQHRQTRQRLGLTLIEKGFLTEDQLAKVLSEALAIPTIDLRSAAVDWSAVHMLRARFCEQHDLFPYGLDQAKGRKSLIVAMADPLNMPAIEEIEFTTGLKVTPRLSPLSQVRAAILRYYHKVTATDPDKMEIVQRGGGSLNNAPPPEEEEVIVGEEVPPGEVTERTALADLIKKREQQRAERRAGKKTPSPTPASLGKDLDYLFGNSGTENELESLERKFWALMRIMARKGMLSREEFQKELDEGE
jgi:hypothetical protein